MCLIGPRPTLRYQVDTYTERQRRRLDVRPGLTGWAQVNGRATLPWAERIELDVWYVEHRSPLVDLKILLRTPLALFGGTYRGAPAAGAVTAATDTATAARRVHRDTPGGEVGAGDGDATPQPPERRGSRGIFWFAAVAP